MLPLQRAPTVGARWSVRAGERGWRNNAEEGALLGNGAL